MSDEQTITVKLDPEEAERLSETNIPQDVVETIYNRHKEVLENGFHRDAVVSEREVPIDNGHVVVWGDWP